VFVGFGYGVRAIVGFWLVGVSDIKALVFLFFGASLFGSTFVALTWALESTRAKREEFSTRKAHLVVFHDAVSRRVTKVSSTEKVLAGHQSLSAPWCWPAILATAALTWFSLYLLREQFHLGPISLRVFGSHLSLSPVVLITMAESCIAGVIVIVPVGPAFYLMGLNLLAMGVLLRSFSVPTSQSVIAATLAGLPLVVTCIFRKMCFRDLPGFTDRLIGVILRGWSGLSSWFTKARGHDEALP